jgi:hypothetical protein
MKVMTSIGKVLLSGLACMAGTILGGTIATATGVGIPAVRVQLLRSALFLAVSVPPLVAWRGSRLRLILALGTAHWAMNGLQGMLQAHWLPSAIRLAHTGEILGDSLAYAAVLVALLAPRAPEALAHPDQTPEAA